MKGWEPNRMIRVMIVEDDPMVAEFNKRYLKQVYGFTLVAMAASVDEAIKKRKSKK